jgi:uncharacterized SAM-binding protein YcdF (DUF218 family)
MNIQRGQKLNTLAECLWDYLRLEQKLQPADCIIVMGSQDLGAVPRAVELLQQGVSDLAVFSGGYGKITQQMWTKTEAETFAQLALNLGMPARQILLETQSSNCGENLMFSMQLLMDKGIKPKRVILVCKPYLERRALATFKQHFPKISVKVTSLQISYRDYMASVIDQEQVIQLMVGDLQRIMLYPAKGWQIPQTVPESVLLAFHTLVSLGFTQQLLVQE